MAGRSSTSVSSTGNNARIGGSTGTSRNAASARRSLPHPRSDGSGAAASRMSALQAPRGRHQREEARTLDGDAQLTLMPRAHAAQAARQDLAVIGDEAAEGAFVLVIDEADAALVEGTRLRSSTHGYSSSSSSSSARFRASSSSSSLIGGAPASGLELVGSRPGIPSLSFRTLPYPALPQLSGPHRATPVERASLQALGHGR